MTTSPAEDSKMPDKDNPQRTLDTRNELYTGTPRRHRYRRRLNRRELDRRQCQDLPALIAHTDPASKCAKCDEPLEPFRITENEQTLCLKCWDAPAPLGGPPE